MFYLTLDLTSLLSLKIFLRRFKQQAPNNILKIDDPPSSRIQVANGLLEKPISRATLKIDIGDNTFAEQLVVRSEETNRAGFRVARLETQQNSCC